MRNFYKAITLISTFALTACATIVEGETDKVELTTKQNIAAVCELKNGRGLYTINAPGSAEIKKSKTSLDINCKDSNGAYGSKMVDSDMESWTLGNILIGGLIGLGIDASTGSLWEYPADIAVNMTIPEPAPVVEQPAPVATPLAPEASIAPEAAPVQAQPAQAEAAPAPAEAAPAETYMEAPPAK